MAQLQFEQIDMIIVAGESLDETDIVSITSPEQDKPFWTIIYREGETVITTGPVLIRGKMLDASMIPSKEELDV